LGPLDDLASSVFERGFFLALGQSGGGRAQRAQRGSTTCTRISIPPGVAARARTGFNPTIGQSAPRSPMTASISIEKWPLIQRSGGSPGRYCASQSAEVPNRRWPLYAERTPEGVVAVESSLAGADIAKRLRLLLCGLTEEHDRSVGPALLESIDFDQATRVGHVAGASREIAGDTVR
jgi:hypothetical protein